MVQPSEGERYYLRTLLIHVKGATSFDDLKTINGYMCSTFKEACILLGLLKDDTEWNVCLHEASQIKTGQQLRHLFAMILLYCQPTTPEAFTGKRPIDRVPSRLVSFCLIVSNRGYSNR